MSSISPRSARLFAVPSATLLGSGGSEFGNRLSASNGLRSASSSKSNTPSE
ncbi:hypothetical protein D3C83_286930 [compost metagenome]